MSSGGPLNLSCDLLGDAAEQERGWFRALGPKVALVQVEETNEAKLGKPGSVAQMVGAFSGVPLIFGGSRGCSRNENPPVSACTRDAKRPKPRIRLPQSNCWCDQRPRQSGPLPDFVGSSAWRN